MSVIDQWKSFLG